MREPCLLSTDYLAGLTDYQVLCLYTESKLPERASPFRQWARERLAKRKGMSFKERFIDDYTHGDEEKRAAAECVFEQRFPNYKEIPPAQRKRFR